MRVPFNWVIWFIVLVIAAVLGSLSGVNGDGIPNFGASVRYGLAHGDVLLILAAVLSAVLLLWLVLAALTGSLSARKADEQRQQPRS